MSPHNKDDEKEPFSLKKVHLVLSVLTAVVIPTAAVVAGYYQAKSDVSDKINAIQIENINTFAKSQDVNKMQDKVDQIASDVSEIKGFLKHKKSIE